jgi:hypothetical protein
MVIHDSGSHVMANGRWMEEQPRTYRREGEGYPSDLTDAEWERPGAADPADGQYRASQDPHSISRR